jgi:hypothetical protein
MVENCYTFLVMGNFHFHFTLFGQYFREESEFESVRNDDDATKADDFHHDSESENINGFAKTTRKGNWTKATMSKIARSKKLPHLPL